VVSMIDTTEERITVYFGNEPKEQFGEDKHWNAPYQKNEAQPEPHTSQLRQIVNTGFAFNMGRQAFSVATGRVGAFTGDYITQNKINNALAITGLLSSVGMSVMTGNPLPIVSTLASVGINAMDYDLQVRLANAKVGILSQIVNTAVISKGRGGGQKI